MAGERAALGIYKRSAGVYDIHVSTGKHGDGRYRKVTKRFRGTLTAAKAERAAMLTAVKAGTLQPAEAITMAELHARYMSVKRIGKNTCDFYDYLWSLLEPHVGSIRVQRLRSDELECAYAAVPKTVGSNTVRKAHKHAVALLNRAMDWGLVSRNVAKKAHPPDAVPFNPTVPTADQQVALVEAAFKQERQFGALVYLAATIGARRGELAGLRWEDIDFVNATVRVVHQPGDADGELRPTKTKKQRYVPIDSDTAQMLHEHREYCDRVAAECGGEITGGCFVFSPIPGNTEPYRLDGISQRWDRLRKATGIKGRLHDQRHAQATKVLADGISPVVVAERLGMSVDVLMATYGHSDKAQERRAASAGALRRS